MIIKHKLILKIQFQVISEQFKIESLLLYHNKIDW